MHVSASPSTTVSEAAAGQRSGAKTLAAVLGLLVVVFAGSVVLREPWRGQLAKGDQWVTGQALRWTRAWYQEGAWRLRLRLVQSPPTAEYEGIKQRRKFGLPGYVLLAYAVFKPLELEPTVERLMWLNLGIHLVTALLLAGVAWIVARETWPGRAGWAALVAAHCGAFVLLFPPIFYWGQNLCINDFLVLPLFTFVVAARWCRSFVGARWGRVLLDLGVALCVVLGTVTEFLFWVLVPYLLVVRRLRRRAGQPNTTDRAWLTVGLPFILVLPVLTFVILIQGTLGYVFNRGGSWAVGQGGGSGLLMLFVVRPWFALRFFFGHFGDAYNFVGFVALGLAAFRLLPRGRVPGLPAAPRGILVDLLVPCLLTTFALAPHAATHTFAAMKFVPFVALAWTFLTPLVISSSRPERRTMLAWAYGIAALLVVSPASNAYSDYFPSPEIRWAQEGTFLREHTLPSDFVYSPTTEIELLPPQRIALAERHVSHVYGPLDIFVGPPDGPPRKLGFLWWPPVNLDTMVALYGPPVLYRAFGADGGAIVTEADRSLVRFPVRRMVEFMASRPDAMVRRRLLDVLAGGLRPTDDALHARSRRVEPLHLPIAMHIIQGLDDTLRYDRLYWTDERHFHWKTADLEYVVAGRRRYQNLWSGVWMPVPEVADASAVDWGRFVTGLFRRAADDAPGSTEFGWRGYDVILMPIDTIPEALRAAAPGITSWEAYLIYKDAMPVAAAIGPARHGAGSDSLNWVCILFDELVVDIGVPGDLVEPWRVRGHAVDREQREPANG